MRVRGILAPVFVLLLAGCVSQHRPTKLGLSDFGRDERVYAAYLQSYSAGYETALRGITEDRCYFRGTEFAATDRAIATGWVHGQSAGWADFFNQTLKNSRHE